MKARQRLAVALIAAVLAGAAGVAVVARRAASLPAPAPLAKTIEQLNAELDSGDPDVRRQAARELGQRLGATSREQRP